MHLLVPNIPGDGPAGVGGQSPRLDRSMILVINAGSSSIKVEVFTRGLTSLISGAVTEIGSTGQLRLGDRKRPASAADHTAALDLLLQALSDAGHPISAFTCAAHRVVHGGADLTAPTLITAAVIETITALIPLAPLHNPGNLAGIRAMTRLAPELAQYASFDTAFHATNDLTATTYAIPAAERAKGIRRYGFHGLSYAALIRQISPLPARLLAFHLGNGASLCAIHHGRSVATSMGYSPLDGLVMGTRSGSIDGMAVLRLAQDHGIDGAANILNRASGLTALTGTNDMATILDRSDDAARFAVDHFCHWAARQAGSAIVAMGGLDAIAFTGGIGENAGAIRDRITAALAFLGPVPMHIIPADEEREIARDATTLLGTKNT